MALEDKARNTAVAVRGKAKDAAGRATETKDMETKGKVERVGNHLSRPVRRSRMPCTAVCPTLRSNRHRGSA